MQETLFLTPEPTCMLPYRELLRRCQKRGTNRQKTGKREKERKIIARPNPYRQPIADVDETFFRHQMWSNVRDKIRKHLVANDTSVSALDRWDNCGAECLVEWSETLQKYRLKASYCHNRHCRPCAKARAGLIAANMRDHVGDVTQNPHRFKFITATLQHSKAPLKQQIKKLYGYFKKLRENKWWKATQRGGCFMLEAPWLIPKAGGPREWHPHLHIISDGDFLRVDILSKVWFKITGGSFKIEIKELKTGRDAIHYVSKYVTKGTNDEIWDSPKAAAEWIEATKGLRTCATYGTWRGFKLMQRHVSNEAKDWQPVSLLSTIVREMSQGSEAACRLYMLLEDALQYDPQRKSRSRATTDSG